MWQHGGTETDSEEGGLQIALAKVKERLCQLTATQVCNWEV
jgi:hypothetical protein